jgi:hypothetical protein
MRLQLNHGCTLKGQQKRMHLLVIPAAMMAGNGLKPQMQLRPIALPLTILYSIMLFRLQRLTMLYVYFVVAQDTAGNVISYPSRQFAGTTVC